MPEVITDKPQMIAMSCFVGKQQQSGLLLALVEKEKKQNYLNYMQSVIDQITKEE